MPASGRLGRLELRGSGIRASPSVCVWGPVCHSLKGLITHTHTHPVLAWAALSSSDALIQLSTKHRKLQIARAQAELSEQPTAQLQLEKKSCL